MKQRFLLFCRKNLARKHSRMHLKCECFLPRIIPLIRYMVVCSVAKKVGTLYSGFICCRKKKNIFLCMHSSMIPFQFLHYSCPPPSALYIPNLSKITKYIYEIPVIKVRLKLCVLLGTNFSLSFYTLTKAGIKCKYII